MRSVIVPASAIAALLIANPAMAADNPLTIKGTLSPAKPGTSVVLVANDGTSLTAPVSKKGRFVLTTRKGAVAKKVNPRKGRGPTLHVIRDGKYMGPVLLKTKSKSRGYARLAAGLPRSVDLGKIVLKSSGYALMKKAPKKSLLDKRLTTLRKGVPLGAGTQGATGSLRMATAARLSADLPASESSLGSDADGDGVPNLADVDMNGDQVLDAAQANGPLQTISGPLSGNVVLHNRPQGMASFAKILDMDRSQAVNSNRNPGVTWEVLTDYLRNSLAIEAIVPASEIRNALCGSFDSECAAALAVTKLTMDCSTLSYCEPGAPATITASPGSGLDRQPLSVLLDPQGRIVVPQDTHVPGTTIMETGFQLNFRPNVTSPDNLQFSGDAFEFTLWDGNGAALGQQTEVLTSSVATPAEWATIDGNPAPMNIQNDPPKVVDLTKPLRLSFFRPQRLADSVGDKPELIDRGGLEYSVYLMANMPGSSGFYWCRASQVTSVSPDLADLTPGPGQGREEMLFDTNMNPQNGEALGFDIDVAGCLNDPAQGERNPPVSGTNITLEMESQDADGNRTRSQVFLQMP